MLKANWELNSCLRGLLVQPVRVSGSMRWSNFLDWPSGAWPFAVWEFVRRPEIWQYFYLSWISHLFASRAGVIRWVPYDNSKTASSFWDLSQKAAGHPRPFIQTLASPSQDCRSLAYWQTRHPRTKTRIYSQCLLVWPSSSHWLAWWGISTPDLTDRRLESKSLSPANPSILLPSQECSYECIWRLVVNVFLLA